MNEVLILIRAQVPLRIRHKFKDATSELNRNLAQVLGFQGFTAWESATKAGSIFVAIEYVDDISAERGLEAWVDFMPSLRMQVPFESTPEVVSMKVQRRIGKHLVSADKESCMSFSHRVSEPGRGDDLRRDVDMVLEGMSLMDGFESGVYGYNDTLNEEILCLATWENEACYAASLPPRDPDYSLELYRRIV